jgi:hypothetical protein
LTVIPTIDTVDKVATREFTFPMSGGKRNGQAMWIANET